MGQPGWGHRKISHLCRALGARAVEAETLDSLGFVHLTLGHHEAAAGYYGRACDVFGDLNRRSDQARVLTNLGGAELAFGATQAAVDPGSGPSRSSTNCSTPEQSWRAVSSATSAGPKQPATPRRRTATTRRAPDPAQLQMGPRRRWQTPFWARCLQGVYALVRQYRST
jgi:hypothetical protein